MDKSKKKIKVSLIGITLGVILITGLICLFKITLPETYNSAKKECEEILFKQQSQMEEIAIDAFKTKGNASGEFEKFFYICYQEENFVKFEIDGQGMLGGQYWDLVYTKDGMLYGENKKFFDEETDENNIVKAERLNEHWWFLWTDYDGTEMSYK